MSTLKVRSLLSLPVSFRVLRFCSALLSEHPIRDEHMLPLMSQINACLKNQRQRNTLASDIGNASAMTAIPLLLYGGSEPPISNLSSTSHSCKQSEQVAQAIPK